MTHTLHRSSNVDKMYNIKTLDSDIVFLSMSAKGYANEKGSADKMRKTLDIAQKFNPVNYGDMRCGNKFDTKLEDIKKNVSDTSIVHAVFDNIENATAFAKAVKEANLGISLVVSAPFDKAWQIADKSGCIGHTIEYSLGIWGKTEKLPTPEVNDFCTMCGHGMISRYLVDDCIKRVKAGKTSAKLAAEMLVKQCVCGIANPTRAAAILTAMATKK